jgi:acetyl-CoA C-acetyltransferase
MKGTAMGPKKKKLGRGVAIVGAGMSRFGVFKEKASRDLFVDAFLAMKASVDRGVDVNAIEALYLGNLTSDLFEGQCHLAPIMADWIGMVPKPATRFEDACASGGVAMREAIIAIASGFYDLILVGGVEKMSNLSTSQVTDTLAAAGDILYEAPSGFTFPGFYAAIATAYMHKYGAKVEHFMSVGLKNHRNGALNPKAQYQATIEDLMTRRIAKVKEKGGAVPAWRDVWDFLKDEEANPVVAWPMRLFDCSPITDGAACLLLAAEELAGSFTDKPVHIIGTGQGSGSAMHGREDVTSLEGARAAAAEAYQMAGVTPQDIKIAEVHDCFTSAEIIASEDLGLFGRGEASRAAFEGATALTGRRPINTSGGLKSKGHPIGASGVAQAVEIWTQMREEAGKRQVKNVDLALTHNVGATGGTCVVHIYERR